jgi:hypothetical protein
MQTGDIEIPQEPLDIRFCNSGRFRHVALHQRKGLFFHESSYSAWWAFGIFLLFGIISLFVYPLAFFGFLFAGVCCVVPFFARNAFGHTIIIDLNKKTPTIRRSGSTQLISLRDIVGLQICFQDDGVSNTSGYQLNLVWSSWPSQCSLC